VLSSFKSLLLIFSTLLLLNSVPTFAQAPLTSSNAKISPEVLDIMMAPLTVDELKAEADGWLALIKNSAHKVAEEKLLIKSLEEQGNASAKTAAMGKLTKLRAVRTGEIDRLNIILERINQKIGLGDGGVEKEDVLNYRRYSDAVGGIKLDTSDASSSLNSLKGWMFSKDGGKRWLTNLVTFLVIVFVFWLLAGFLSGMTRKALRFSTKQSQLLTNFLVGMVHRIVMIIGIILGLSALEVDIAPLLAVIGAASFVVAFALQGTLSNFASGIMIMLYRPFDVGDAVDVAGVSGVVSSLNLVSTTVTTFDNKRMIVPNNAIWGNTITNASASNERRIDFTFGIGYGDDIDLALSVLNDIVAKHPLVLKDPAPTIKLHELADSSVNFICRPWVKTGDYWAVYWDIMHTVKVRFDAEGLSIPYPQQDLHIYQEQPSLVAPEKGTE